MCLPADLGSNSGLLHKYSSSLNDPKFQLLSHASFNVSATLSFSVMQSFEILQQTLATVPLKISQKHVKVTFLEPLAYSANVINIQPIFF